MKKLHLRLTVDVIYDAGHSERPYLRALLGEIPMFCAVNGLFTGQAVADVHSYRHKVKEIKPKKRAPKKTHPK